MFSMFPSKALMLTLMIVFIGIAAGYITDCFYKKQDKLIHDMKHELQIHEMEDCHCFPKDQILRQLQHISFQRVLLISILGVLLGLFFSGTIGPQIWNWKKITFTAGSLFGLFVVLTVPDHFLEEHLWEHLLKKHLLRIFLWTFGALLVIHYLDAYLDLEEWIQSNYITVLMVAVLVGIIPESGPHMIIVTLFANGSLPFSILLASSIVQDGHGMLPMLAISKRGFILVKIINMIAGFLAGLIGLMI